MKKSLKTMMLAGSLLAVSNTSFAEDSITTTRYVGDTAYASFCRAVVLDDIRVLRASLSRQVGRLAASQRAVLQRVTDADGLKCNGENLIDFSKRRNAADVHAFLTAANQ